MTTFYRRPRLLLGLALALGSRLAGSQVSRATQPQPTPETQKAHKPTRMQRWAGDLAERRRWLIRWAPSGGGLSERRRRQRQINARTLNASSGLVPFTKD